MQTEASARPLFGGIHLAGPIATSPGRQSVLAVDEMLLTHEFIALMIGVRRAGVTGALQDFESMGLITTARGSVTMKDRDGLEECAQRSLRPTGSRIRAPV